MLDSSIYGIGDFLDNLFELDRNWSGLFGIQTGSPGQKYDFKTKGRKGKSKREKN